MKYLLYCCILFILGHYLDARVVKLKGASKEEQRSSASSSEHDVPIDISKSDVSQEKSSGIDSDESNNGNESKEYDDSEPNVSGDHGGNIGADEDQGITNNNKGKVETDKGKKKPTGGGNKDKGKKKQTGGGNKDKDKNKSADGTDGSKKKPADEIDGGKDKPADGTDGDEDKPADTLEIPEDIRDIDKENNIEKYNNTENAKTWDLWKSEVMADNFAKMYASNQHILQPDEYPHLNKRFVPQYPYTYVEQNNEAAPKTQTIVPIEASPEIVELVAMKSALIEASKPNHINNQLTPNMLRSGDYWNGVWKEDVYPKSALRKPEQKSLGTIKARILPGSDFYNVVAELKTISPKLLYIINVDN